MTEFVIYDGGEFQVRQIHGIDFSFRRWLPSPVNPKRWRTEYRIGDTKVPAWLYELVRDQALELDGESNHEGDKP